MSRVLDLIKSVSGNGSTADATTTNTPPAAENSKKIANTEWVRTAMANIASTAGFATTKAATGYIKLPSWLGGLIVQWGQSGQGAASGAVLTFPIPFPNACLTVSATMLAASPTFGYFPSVTEITNSTFKLHKNYTNATTWSPAVEPAMWIAIGH